MNPENIYPRTNDHETVYLKNVIKNPNILVGDFTMYNDFVYDPQQFEKNNVLYHYPINHDKLIIGKFCSIACGAKFLFTSANHTQASLSTYPFPIFFEEWGLDVQNITSAWDNKGDIIIGNDVWIGYEAVILSGVTIGDGAIIGTRAVVTKDVPPYTIVGGVPAKTIRKRFSDDTILQINWWDWPEEKIKQHISDIQAGRIDRLQPLCNRERYLEHINHRPYAGASPALMGACAERGIDLAFFTPNGRFLARTVGEERGNVLLRQQQYRIADDPAVSCRYACGFILGKVYNARWVLERATRDHPQRVPVERLKEISSQLAASLMRIRECGTLEELRGLEGEAAQRYFDGFDSLILQQRTDFAFTGRSRRPPLDPINAVLSFAYTLLARECAAALQSVGLDPYVGFLHRPCPGRSSLALDLMEELRPVCADRFVLSCINQKIVTGKHCQRQDSGAVWLTDEGRKAFLSAWQKRKRETITHPFLGEKLPWGLVPYVQALLLARTLRGDLEEYPPFFWK